MLHSVDFTCFGTADVVDLLLRQGADETIKDTNGLVAVDIVSSRTKKRSTTARIVPARARCW